MTLKADRPPNRFRFPIDHLQQGTCSAGWLASALFPFLNRPHADAEDMSKSRL